MHMYAAADDEDVAEEDWDRLLEDNDNSDDFDTLKNVKKKIVLVFMSNMRLCD